MKKFIALLLLPIFITFSTKPAYAAYFYDNEVSANNIFSATTLDFSLEQDANKVKVKKDGMLDFKYNFGYSKTSGDDVLCDVLQVDAKLDGLSIYTGSLAGLNIPEQIISGDQDDWEIAVTFTNSSELENKSCAFNLTFKGWQTDSDGSWGFSDEEVIQYTIEPELTISENPSATDSSLLVSTQSGTLDETQ